MVAHCNQFRANLVLYLESDDRESDKVYTIQRKVDLEKGIRLYPFQSAPAIIIISHIWDFSVF
jgi:hypothetical protein